MATLHIAWVNFTHPQQGIAPALIEEILLAEALGTSASSAQSAAAPARAEYAVCTSVDANHYVTVGSNPTAGATNSIAIVSGSREPIPVSPGQKIAAVTI